MEEEHLCVWIFAWFATKALFRPDDLSMVWPPFLRLRIQDVNHKLGFVVHLIFRKKRYL
jgi:hypothetical protein